MKRKLLAAILAVALAAAVSAAPAMSQTAKKKFTIVYGGDAVSFMLVYVALGANLFAAEGLDVDFVNVGSGPRAAAAALGGSADMSIFGLLHVITAQSEGADLVAVSTLFDAYPVNVVLSEKAIASSGILPGMSIDEKLKRIKGLKIAISSPGSAVDQFIRSLLLKRNIEPESHISLLPLGAGTAILTAFEKKIVDGFVYPAPLPEIAHVKDLGKSVIDPIVDDIPELKGVPWGVLGASRTSIQTKHESIAAAVRGMVRAIQFVEQKPAEETYQIMRKYFAEIDERALKLAVEGHRKGLPKTPVISRTQVERTAAWLQLTSAKPIDAKYESIVNTEIAESAAK